MQVNTETTHDNALASGRRHKHAVANAAGVQCGMHDAIVSPIDGRSLTRGGLAQPYRPRMSKHRHVADWSNFERANSSQATTIDYLVSILRCLWSPFVACSHRLLR